MRIQSDVDRWVLHALGREAATDLVARARAFAEEAAELAQACSLPKDLVIALVSETYARPKGEKLQELGGTCTTLCALASALHADLETAGACELERMWSPAVIARVQKREADGWQRS